jgi:proline dehydrogenase
VTWSDPLRRRRASAYRAGPGVDEALDVSRRLAAQGLACTIGYAPAPGEPARAVADVHLAAFERLSAEGLDGHVSVKLSALGFDASLVAELADAAARSQRPMHIDALAPETVDTTWLLLQRIRRSTGLGTTLPGRWRRSVLDTSLAAQLSLRVRVVKGQWADVTPGTVDPAEGFLHVVDRLRGHREGVAVATHDVNLLAESLRRLGATDTPCSAELLFGLPLRAAVHTARRFGVPVRVYVPYGHTGAPYGIADLPRRPRAAWWLLQDLVLGKEKTWRSIEPRRRL